jgi:hypothetical protein
VNISWNEASIAVTAANAYFFYRFHRRTRERVFALLAAAFCIMALERVMLALAADWTAERRWPVYLMRLGAFLLIIAGVAEKSLRSRTPRLGAGGSGVGGAA